MGQRQGIIGRGQAASACYGQIIEASKIVLQAAKNGDEFVVRRSGPDRAELVGQIAQELERFAQIVALILGQKGQIGAVRQALLPDVVKRLDGKRGQG